MNIIYEIKLKGYLNESWADWFDGMTFTHESDGITQESDAITILTGEVKDQAALHGMLKIVRDLGLFLISVNILDPDHYIDIGADTNE